MNCLINIVLVFSNFLSDDCLKLLYCSMVFVNCIELHVFVLLHTFVLPLRLGLKSKAQGLTQGKRSRFFMKIREIHVLFLGKNQGNSGKKSKILSELCYRSGSLISSNFFQSNFQNFKPTLTFL